MSNHLWQSTVFAIMAGLLTLAFRRNRAQVRYCLWFSASFKFLIPFSLLLTLGGYLGRSRPARTMTVPAITYTVVRAAEPFRETPRPAPENRNNGDWIPIVAVSLWACGFAGILLMRLRGWLRIWAVVRSSTPMDIAFPLEVRSSPALLEPGVVGFFRPILLCPAGIVERLSPSQLQAVLAHELCHVQRRDNLTGAIHMIVEAVFWFHPLVWWISARLMEERERACDEQVLELGSDRQVYADSILKTCEFCVESPLTCVCGVTGADLKKRIVRIMTEHMPNKLSLARMLLLGAWRRRHRWTCLLRSRERPPNPCTRGANNRCALAILRGCFNQAGPFSGRPPHLEHTARQVYDTTCDANDAHCVRLQP
ncbi:MAG: M56 family metallopeptidase [Terriglobia bacterium]